MGKDDRDYQKTKRRSKNRNICTDNNNAAPKSKRQKSNYRYERNRSLSSQQRQNYVKTVEIKQREYELGTLFLDDCLARLVII